MYYRQRDDKTRAVSFMISHIHEDEKIRQRELFEGPLFTPILERQLAADAFGLSLCLTWMAAKEHRLLHNVYTQMRGLVLDLGCGTGRRLNRLAAEWNIHGIGLDIALRQLRENTLHNPFHHFYINGDVEKTPFRSESFELVICMDVLEHVPSPQRCILETARLLTPEGIAFFYTNSSRQEGTLPDILRRLTKGKLGSDHGHAGEHHPEMFLSPEQFVCLCRDADLEVMELISFHAFFTYLVDALMMGTWTAVKRFVKSGRFPRTTNPMEAHVDGQIQRPRTSTTLSLLRLLSGAIKMTLPILEVLDKPWTSKGLGNGFFGIAKKSTAK